MNYQRIFEQMERNRIKAREEQLYRMFLKAQYPRSARTVVVGGWNRLMLKIRGIYG